MFTKKILIVVATALVGLTMGVGCVDADGGGSTGQTPEALVVSNDPMLLGELKRPTRPSAVTCSGHQDQGGRICCDAKHCCINIKGVINCSLPPRTKQ
jgi:hypothetical protein